MSDEKERQIDGWKDWQNLILKTLEKLEEHNEKTQNDIEEIKIDTSDLNVKIDNLEDKVDKLDSVVRGNSTKGLVRRVERHNTLFYIYGAIILPLVAGIVKLIFF